MVPGAEARGLVAPRMERPVLTASRPSQTMAQMGPEFMSVQCLVSTYPFQWWDSQKGLRRLIWGFWKRWGCRTGDQSGEEGLAGKVGVVLLEVLLSGADELDGSKLEAAVLEAGDDGANQAALVDC
jgi:hypothetical protein